MQPISHEEATRLRRTDPAWVLFGEARTNYSLDDGDRCTLLAETLGNGARCDYRVPTGVKGVVVRARCPRVYQERPGISQYFANVDIDDPVVGMVRIRVPHAALKRQTSRRR